MKAKLWRLRSVQGVLFVLFLMLGPLSAVALAHNQLLKTEPVAHAALKAAPGHVELWFAEKPDMTVTKVAVKGPSGHVETGPVHSMAGNTVMADFKSKLAPGEYTVSWQTAGDDGHVSKGDFSFSVAAQ